MGIIQVGNVPVQVLGTLPGRTVRWSSGMRIDVDGSPRAYHPVSSRGLDRLANAGRPAGEAGPACWWGVVTDTGRADGRPVIQGPQDPAPGFYVSTTALVDPRRGSRDPRRYVDAATVPYIAIPPELRAEGVALGDACWVSARGRACAAVVADIGPRRKIGEGSPALARELGIDPDARVGGASQGVTYVVFCGTTKGWPRARMELVALVDRLAGDLGLA